MPESASRCAIQSGVAASGSRPLTTRATKTGQPTGIVDHDRVAVSVGSRDVALRRIGVRRVVRQGRLAGHAAQREGVGAVRVDLELDDLLVETEHRAGIGAGLAGALGQHDDPLVVLADPELAGGADHPGAHVAVGLAGGDLEVPREHPTGQDHHDQVTGREVVGAADDALGLAGTVGRANINLAPLDRLAVLLRLGLHREHPADHQRAPDLLARLLDRLQLEAERSQSRRRAAPW